MAYRIFDNWYTEAARVAKFLAKRKRPSSTTEIYYLIDFMQSRNYPWSDFVKVQTRALHFMNEKYLYKSLHTDMKIQREDAKKIAAIYFGEIRNDGKNWLVYALMELPKPIKTSKEMVIQGYDDMLNDYPKQAVNSANLLNAIKKHYQEAK